VYVGETNHTRKRMMEHIGKEKKKDSGRLNGFDFSQLRYTEFAINIDKNGAKNIEYELQSICTPRLSQSDRHYNPYARREEIICKNGGSSKHIEVLNNLKVEGLERSKSVLQLCLCWVRMTDGRINRAIVSLLKEVCYLIINFSYNIE
jgi:hypothetical protein